MRIKERDLALPALRIAAASSGGYIATSDLIIALEKEFTPSGEDAEILDGRYDTKFSQKVRNLVYHRTSSTSIFAKGYANYVKDGLQITDLGRNFVDQAPEWRDLYPGLSHFSSVWPTAFLSQTNHA